MASIEEVAKAVRKYADGIEKESIECITSNPKVVRDMIQEQLYSGMDGTDHLLKPTYDNDPYFNEEGPWQGRSKQYKKWKEKITPPITSYLLNLPPRPLEVPNLFITGTFYDSIKVVKSTNGVQIFTSGFVDGDEIVRKYGDNILTLGPIAREYFILMHLRPWLTRFMMQCGF